jgi:hypothetical protein
MDERITFGNPPSMVGDSQFAALGRYLAAKKDGLEPDPADWEEIIADADADTVMTLAEPSAETYATYGKVYKGFMQEIARRTFDEALERVETESDREVAGALQYEIDRTLRQGKAPTKGQIRDVLTKYEEEFNLPINETTMAALTSWLKAKLATDKKTKKKQEKLKEAAASLAKTVQVARDEKGLRRLILREMVAKGRITEGQFTELCASLFLTDEEPA